MKVIVDGLDGFWSSELAYRVNYLLEHFVLLAHLIVQKQAFLLVSDALVMSRYLVAYPLYLFVTEPVPLVRMENLLEILNFLGGFLDELLVVVSLAASSFFSRYIDLLLWFNLR